MNDEPKYVWIIVGVVCAIIGIGALALFYRTSARVEVTQVVWSRAINIEQWRTVQESGWSVPQGGREIRSYPAVHHWQTYVSGYTSTTTCSGKPSVCKTTQTPKYSSEPVYQVKYDYDIERWVVVRTPELHGEGHEARWPDVSDLKSHDQLTLGDERAGMRISRYTVLFTKDYSLDISEERWRSFKPGQSATLILNIFKQPLDVEQPI